MSQRSEPIVVKGIDITKHDTKHEAGKNEVCVVTLKGVCLEDAVITLKFKGHESLFQLFPLGQTVEMKLSNSQTTFSKPKTDD